MTCNEAQRYITPFINDELEPDKIEGFLNHVERCSECREELEVYYTLLNGMKQLNEEENLPNDFHQAFLHKMRKEEDAIVIRKLQYLRKRFLLLLVICVISMISSIGISEYVTEEDTQSNETVSSQFMLKYYFFMNKETDLDRYILENKNEIIRYKLQMEINQIQTSKGETHE